MRILRVIVIDSDTETINQLKLFEINNSVLFTITKIINDFEEIIAHLNSHKPDAIIVKIDNFFITEKLEDVLNNLEIQRPKLIVISNEKAKAYDAFKLNAIDFLLTPINNNELIISLYKSLRAIDMETAYQNDKITKIKAINSLHDNFEYIAVASMDKIELLKNNDIIFCKADGKYTEFHLTGKSKILSSRNLGEYNDSLGPTFFRIHHSYLINIRYLTKIVKKDGLYCELSNGITIPVAKRRQEEFIRYIKL